MASSEKEKRRWYMEEAERLITDGREDELVEILKVRDSACALYAVATRQLTDKFPDSDVVAWLDQEAAKRFRN